MITCKEASLLASKSLDAKLTWRERLGLRLHVSFCKLCSRYLQDLNKLSALLRNMRQSGQIQLPDTITLPALSRERIRRALSKAFEPPNR